jgi:hypothetical protein
MFSSSASDTMSEHQTYVNLIRQVYLGMHDLEPGEYSVEFEIRDAFSGSVHSNCQLTPP